MSPDSAPSPGHYRVTWAQDLQGPTLLSERQASTGRTAGASKASGQATGNLATPSSAGREGQAFQHSLRRPSEVQDLGGTAASPAHWDHCDWHPPSPHVAVQQPVSPTRLLAPEGKRVSHCGRRLEPQCLVQISGLPLTIGASRGPLTDLSVSLFPHPSREIILEPTHGITN